VRIVFFLLLSLVLHAAALSYPVFFPAPRAAELLPVIVLGPGDGSEGEAEEGTFNEKSTKGQNQRRPKGNLLREAELVRPDLNQPRVRATKAVRQADTDRVDTNLIEIPTASEGNIAATANQTGRTPWEAGSAGFASLAGDGGGGSHEGIGAAGGNGYGKGNGTGSGVTTGKRVGVKYVYSPKPEYPESARKEGCEGTVVLRVLVDEDGRSKSLEVNRSSGFETLDQAALNAVRHWRFSAARYGDHPVESWVNVPIIFRLTEAKDDRS
jgi:TonB family protein